MKKLTYLTSGGTALVVLNFLFGLWHMSLAIVGTLIILDLLTGLAAAFINKEVRSRKMTEGIIRKFMMVSMITVGQLLDLFWGVGFIRDFIVGALIINEVISITENFSKAGVPVPQKLIQLLDIAKTAVGNGQDPRHVVKQEIESIKESVASVEEVVEQVDIQEQKPTPKP